MIGRRTPIITYILVIIFAIKLELLNKYTNIQGGTLFSIFILEFFVSVFIGYYLKCKKRQKRLDILKQTNPDLYAKQQNFKMFYYIIVLSVVVILLLFYIL